MHCFLSNLLSLLFATSALAQLCWHSNCTTDADCIDCGDPLFQQHSVFDAPNVQFSCQAGLCSLNETSLTSLQLSVCENPLVDFCCLNDQPAINGTTLCQSKRCKQVIGCTSLGTCEYEGIDVEDDCCRRSSDCSALIPAPCEEAQCIAGDCERVAVTGCCVDDSDCPSGGLATCQTNACVPIASPFHALPTLNNECQVFVDELCTCATDADCGTSTCADHTCDTGTSTCATAPKSPLPIGCCNAATDCPQFGDCTPVVGCVSEDDASPFHLPTFECVYGERITTSCCNADSDCAAQAAQNSCLSDKCGVDGLCELLTGGAVPCCRVDADCEPAVPADDRCAYLTCNGVPGSLVTFDEAYTCVPSVVGGGGGCVPGTLLAAPPIDATSLVSDCIWDCPNNNDPNTLRVVATFTNPVSSDRPLYEYRVLVTVSHDGGATQTVAGASLALVGEPSFSFGVVSTTVTGSLLQQTFEPDALLTIYPANQIQLEATVPFAYLPAATTYTLTIDLVPYHTCTDFFVGATPSCTQPAADAGTVEIALPTIESPPAVVELGNGCSEQCVGAGTPSPTPAGPGGGDDGLLVAQVAALPDGCNFADECATDLTHQSINRYSLRVTLRNLNTFATSAPDYVAFVDLPALYTVPSSHAVDGSTSTLMDDVDMTPWTPLLLAPQPGVDLASAPVVSLGGELAFDVRFDWAAGATLAPFTLAQLYSGVTCTQALVDEAHCLLVDLGTEVPVRVDSVVSPAALGCELELCAPTSQTDVERPPLSVASTCAWDCNDGDPNDDNRIELELCFDNSVNPELPLRLCAFDALDLTVEEATLLELFIFTEQGGVGSMSLDDSHLFTFDPVTSSFVGVAEFGDPTTAIALQECPLLPAGVETCFTARFGLLIDEWDTAVLARLFGYVHHPCHSVYPMGNGCSVPTVAMNIEAEFLFSSFSNEFGFGEASCPAICESELPFQSTDTIRGQFFVDADLDTLQTAADVGVVPGLVLDLVIGANSSNVGVATTNANGVFEFALSEALLAYSGDIYVQLRTDTVPLGFEPSPLTNAPGFAADALVLLGSNFRPSDGRGVRVNPAASGVFTLQTGSVRAVQPCERDFGPFADDALVLAIADPVCTHSGTEPELALEACTAQVCGSRAVYETIALEYTLANHHAVEYGPSSIELRAQALSPEHVHCMELVEHAQSAQHNALLVEREAQVAGPGGVGESETHVAFAYTGGIEPNELLGSRMRASLVYCGSAQSEFNVTARRHGDECALLIAQWSRCEQGLDYRECYSEHAVDPGILLCATPAPTPAPPTDPPTPAPTPAGGLGSSGFEIVPLEDCFSALCVDRKLLRALNCTASAEAQCTGQSDARGVELLGATFTNVGEDKRGTVALHLTLERHGDFASACGTEQFNALFDLQTGPLLDIELTQPSNSSVHLRLRYDGKAMGEAVTVRFFAFECLLPGQYANYTLAARVEAETCTLPELCSVVVAPEPASHFAAPRCADDCPRPLPTHLSSIEEFSTARDEVSGGGDTVILVGIIAAVLVLGLCCIVLLSAASGGNDAGEAARRRARATGGGESTERERRADRDPLARTTRTARRRRNVVVDV